MSTTFGDDGLVDTSSTGSSRTYQSYVEEDTETGKRTTVTSYGNDGKREELSFTNRADERSKDETVTASGKDTTTEKGYRYSRAADKLEIIRALFADPSINDFLAVVYNDLDAVLTCPIFV